VGAAKSGYNTVICNYEQCCNDFHTHRAGVAAYFVADRIWEKNFASQSLVLYTASQKTSKLRLLSFTRYSRAYYDSIKVKWANLKLQSLTSSFFVMLRDKNYQYGPMFHEVIQKIKAAPFFETLCIFGIRMRALNLQGMKFARKGGGNCKQRPQNSQL